MRGAEARPRIARLERDLERVLEDLADDFPLLQSLVDRRAGGQKRLPMPGRGREPVPAPLFADALTADEGDEPAATPQEGDEPPAATGKPPQTPGAERGTPEGDADGGVEPPPAAPCPDPPSGRPGTVATSGAVETVAGRRRAARYGLLVQFESRPDDVEMARLVDSTIWINDAHPAYTRALASRSVGYHTALAVALALASLAVEPEDEHAFITQFLAHWGGAQSSTHRGARRRARKQPA
jgi:hypothetical protein